MTVGCALHRRRAHPTVTGPPVKGLLVAEGRRSFRDMALCLGGGAALEQRLHHFASCSTWDWPAVRRAVARLAVARPPFLLKVGRSVPLDVLASAPAEPATPAVSARTAENSFAHITDEVGARDFTGRPDDGRHRHMTLVSVAHVVRTRTV
ncbi:hypothetical protein GCM10010329_23370 [Streptomyces spiroverticillatus]|uniref:Transposase IS701-like DDE domain-containing protein n=1 Tax=Streptomyces finlayi TaxID=67296 RepID=A0A919C8E0_9ACTN|nr:transposase [Streptomyces finlayi]GHA01039.1 hypothetical protein GCM10010329_23370 [Streptomyces spiroverticillatus]GHC85528.1 hypothetical protein GCM10010334_15790 [Streptomyces finlayi]